MCVVVAKPTTMKVYFLNKHTTVCSSACVTDHFTLSELGLFTVVYSCDHFVNQLP